MIVMGKDGTPIEIEEAFDERTHRYDAESGKIVPLTEREKQLWAEILDAQFQGEMKRERSRYFDAYRKYQAAVNYGEFAKAAEVDAFVAALRNKDWTVYDSVPSQLRYFLGEVGLDESWLVKG